VENRELEPVVMMSGSNGEDACRVFFYGEYHYCGDAGPGYVWCCPGDSL